MNPHQRRLQADYDRMIPGFAGHPFITVEAIGPLPPEGYRVLYRVPGLRLDAENRLHRVSHHVIHIQLPAGYPREKPYCTSADQVFHPNFGAYVCIADFWSPSQSLLDIVVQIGDMLQYKLFNTRSPLNAVAARWVTEHVNELPLASLDLLPQEPEIKLRATATASIDPTQTGTANG